MKGKHYAELRQKLNLTQDMAAVLTGYSVKSIQQTESKSKYEIPGYLRKLEVFDKMLPKDRLQLLSSKYAQLIADFAADTVFTDTDKYFIQSHGVRITMWSQDRTGGDPLACGYEEHVIGYSGYLPTHNFVPSYNQVECIKAGDIRYE